MTPDLFSDAGGLPSLSARCGQKRDGSFRPKADIHQLMVLLVPLLGQPGEKRLSRATHFDPPAAWAQTAQPNAFGPDIFTPPVLRYRHGLSEAQREYNLDQRRSRRAEMS